MPQSLVKILVHIVFSTKDRIRLIPPDFEPQLYGYISGIITNNGGRMIIAGGDADHSHIPASIGRIDISELIGDIKRDSSSWIKKQDRRFAKFYWQRGYGAFSIGQSQVPAVSEYIRNQKEHHRTQSYQDEFRELCANTRSRSMNDFVGINIPSPINLAFAVAKVRKLLLPFRERLRAPEVPRVTLASLASP